MMETPKPIIVLRDEMTCLECGDTTTEDYCPRCGDGTVSEEERADVAATALVPTLSYLREGEYILQ